MTTTPESGNVPEDIAAAAEQAFEAILKEAYTSVGYSGQYRLVGKKAREIIAGVILAERERHQWLPIEQADRSIATVQAFPDVSITLRNSYPVWVRDDDGRVYEAVWSEGTASYWWDLEGESPVDPVEFMPHPLDPRFHAPKGGAA